MWCLWPRAADLKTCLDLGWNITEQIWISTRPENFRESFQCPSQTLHQDQSHLSAWELQSWQDAIYCDAYSAYWKVSEASDGKFCSVSNSKQKDNVVEVFGVSIRSMSMNTEGCHDAIMTLHPFVHGLIIQCPLIFQLLKVSKSVYLCHVTITFSCISCQCLSNTYVIQWIQWAGNS